MTGSKQNSTIAHEDALLEFIRQFQAENNSETPSRRDMAREFNTSTSVINYWLGSLKKRDIISYEHYKPKTIVINTLRTVSLFICPVLGCKETSTYPYLKCRQHNRTMHERQFREL